MHGKASIDGRPSAEARGYGAKWTAYSAEYRERNPWCVTCARNGKRIAVALVDHIKPVAGPDDPTFWDPNNHQGLCRSCHAVKTKAEGLTARSQAAADAGSRKVILA
jgi:5-methylcytosine-specific restriction protein A